VKKLPIVEIPTAAHAKLHGYYQIKRGQGSRGLEEGDKEPDVPTKKEFTGKKLQKAKSDS